MDLSEKSEIFIIFFYFGFFDAKPAFIKKDGHISAAVSLLITRR